MLSRALDKLFTPTPELTQQQRNAAGQFLIILGIIFAGLLNEFIVVMRDAFLGTGSDGMGQTIYTLVIVTMTLATFLTMCRLFMEAYAPISASSSRSDRRSTRRRRR